MLIFSDCLHSTSLVNVYNSREVLWLLASYNILHIRRLKILADIKILAHIFLQNYRSERSKLLSLLNLIYHIFHLGTAWVSKKTPITQCSRSKLSLAISNTCNARIFKFV